jgi:hypothetical protein
VSGQGDRKEGKRAGILIPRKAGDACRRGRDLLVADQRAIEARRPALGDEVGDDVVDGIIGILIAGTVVALKVKGCDLS